MATLHHYPLSPSCRLVRLQLAEYDIQLSMKTWVMWDQSQELLSLNPTGQLPIFEDEKNGIIPGARVISEWVEEVMETAWLMPKTPGERAETRRLVDWFEVKFWEEVSKPLLRERVIKRFQSGETISSELLRIALSNARVHLDYIDWLAAQDAWLVGRSMTLADFAAAAHLSVLDYFGDIQWEQFPDAKMWYMKLKSRPSFRPLLADIVVGMPPAPHYSIVDF